MKLANKAAVAIQSTKTQFRLPLTELENTAVNQTTCIMSEDFSEGIDAFRNRRRPEFSR